MPDIAADSRPHVHAGPHLPVPAHVQPPALSPPSPTASPFSFQATASPSPALSSAPKQQKLEDGPFLRGKSVRLPKGLVNYCLEGPEFPAPLVVCIHGLNGSIATFSNFQPLLCKAGFRTLTFDLYGFGLSASPYGRLDNTTYVDQVHGLLEAIGVPPEEKVLLLGFSMGGVIAVEFVRRFPEKVKRLLLVAPGGLLQRSQTPCRPLLFGCLRGRFGCGLLYFATMLACCCSCVIRRRCSPEKLADRFQIDVREPDNFRDLSQQNGERCLWNLSRSVNSYLRVLKRMPLWEEDFEDAYTELAASNIPLLFIWGDNDGTIPLCEVEDKVKQIFGPKGVSCIQIPGGCHGMLTEDAGAVANCAAAFFHDLQDPAWKQCLAMWRLPSKHESVCADRTDTAV